MPVATYGMWRLRNLIGNVLLIVPQYSCEFPFSFLFKTKILQTLHLEFFPKLLLEKWLLLYCFPLSFFRLSCKLLKMSHPTYTFVHIAHHLLSQWGSQMKVRGVPVIFLFSGGEELQFLGFLIPIWVENSSQ
jgi:hypothetical protein